MPKHSRLGPLTEKEEEICHLYIGEAKFNKVEALRLSAYRCDGVTSKIDINIFKRPRVIARIADLMEERCNALRITSRTVLGEAFMCYMQAKSEGKWSAAARFLEMVGKHVDVDAFRLRLEHTGPGGGPIPVEVLRGLTEEELVWAERIHLKLAPPDAANDGTGQGGAGEEECGEASG